MAGGNILHPWVRPCPQARFFYTFLVFYTPDFVLSSPLCINPIHRRDFCFFLSLFCTSVMSLPIPTGLVRPAPTLVKGERCAWRATSTDQLPVAFPGTLASANNVPALFTTADAILVFFVAVWRHRRRRRRRRRRCHHRRP